MTQPVGYLINQSDGFHGRRGIAYDYILAGNGLFIEASGPHISACIQASDTPVRGLAKWQSRVELHHGKIPGHLWELALNMMLADRYREVYLAITWDFGSYHIHQPNQKQGTASVEFEALPDTVLDLHSHVRGLSAFFSSTDNRDEQGLKLYGVTALAPKGTFPDGIEITIPKPVVLIRAGAYGYFQDMKWSDIFEGELTSAFDASDQEWT